MTRPRIGFVGVGWIGRHRMAAMLATGAVDAAAIFEPSAEMRDAALTVAPAAAPVESFEALLDRGVDGVVIASPSALHADQSIRALEAGTAVFCQKPLGRSAVEARGVVDAASRADRLLAVDFSYRFTEGMRQIRDLVRSGALGKIYAVDLIFHNAYGPDKAWFYDKALSGGGCLMDLGVHLIDLAMWVLDFPAVSMVSATLVSAGEKISEASVEDYAAASFTLGRHISARLACSWRLPAGQDAVISAAFYGTDGGAALRNVGGSFFDFTAERFAGTERVLLASPPDDWGGRAAADWATRLAHGARYDPEAERLIAVAEVLDRIYAA